MPLRQLPLLFLTSAFARLKINRLAVVGLPTLSLALLLMPLVAYLVITSPSPVTATTGINNAINIQGKVTNSDGTNVADGTYDFVFKLYDGAGSGATNTFTESWTSATLFSSTMTSAPSSGGESTTYSSNTNESSLKPGQLMWNVTKGEAVKIVSVNTTTNVITHSPTAQAWNISDTITNKVFVKDGIFQVALNSLNADANWGTTDFSQDTIYLGINFNVDGEMKPRSQFNSVAYAQQAKQVTGLSIASGKTLTVNNTVTFSGTDGTSFTLPTASDTLVGLAANQALTNKTINGLTISSTTGTLTIASGKTLTLSNTLTFAGTDGQTFTFPNGSSTVCTIATGCGGGVSADSLDFTEFKDAMTLDANTDIALSSLTLSASGTGAVQFNNTGGLSTASDFTVGANKSVKLTGGTSFPGSPSEGQIFYRTDTFQLYTYANGKWQADRSTATEIVAASNSQNKEKADFVGNGTADDVAINAAISALPSGGGVIYLLDGTYNITTSIVIAKSNVKIIGAGKSTILKRMWDETSANTSGVITLGDNTNAYSGIAIEGIAIDGNKASYTNANDHGILLRTRISNSQISDSWITNNKGNAIYMYGGSGSGSANTYNTISNTDLSTSNDGIYLYYYNNQTLISGNTFRSNTNMGAELYATNDYTTLSNNFFTGNTTNGIYSTQASNLTLIGNTVTGSGADGVYIYSDSKITIAGNSFISNTGNGLTFRSSTDSSVSNNTASDNSAVGIYLYISAYRNSVTGNTVKGNASDGIIIGGGGDSNIVSSNALYNNGGSGSSSGITVGDVFGGATNNTIVGNGITDTAGTGYAIYIKNTSTGNVLSGNTYSGTGATSISDNATNTIYSSQLNSTNLILKPTGNIGLGTTTPSAQLHEKGNVATAMTGTFGVTNASASVSTSTDQTSVLKAGDAITFASQAGSVYTVSSLNATTITLTANYTGTTNASTTATRDVTNLFQIDNGAGTTKLTFTKTGQLVLGSPSANEQLNLDGRIYLADSSAPSTTTNRLYAVSGNLYWNGTQLGGGSIAADSLDFTEFKDAMALDASTSINLGSFNLSTSGSGGVAFGHSGDTTFAGQVGIGSASAPGAALQVTYLSANSTATSPGIIIDNPATGTQDSIAFKFNGSTKGLIAVDSGGSIHLSGSNNATTYIAFNNLGTPGAVDFQNGQVVLTSSGKLGIGTSATALLTLKAGTSSANTAPLKFTSGTNLSAPEAGAMEWDGTNLYITQTSGPTRKTIAFTDSNITGSAGSVPFSGVTAATNTNTLVIGTGGSLSVSGSGTIAATSAPLSGITAATTTSTIANGSNAIAWNWGSLTTQTGLTLGGGTAMTTGSILNIGSAAFTHGATDEYGAAANISVTDKTSASIVDSYTAGLKISGAYNTTTTAVSLLYGLDVAAPTYTACGGSCWYSGIHVGTTATGINSNTIQMGIEIEGKGISTGTLYGIAFDGITPGAGTETAIYIKSGWDTVLHVGSNDIINGSGVLTSAGLSGTYSNALTLSSASNVFTAATYNGLAITSTTGTLTIASGKTLTASNTLTFTGTDGTSFAFPSSSSTVCTMATGCGGGGGLFTQGTGLAYLTTTTDDLVLGGTSAATGTFFMDVSAGTLYLGKDAATNGALTFYSSTTGKSASIFNDASGNLTLTAGSGGAVIVGSGSGNINLTLANASDLLLADKTTTLAGTLSSVDFQFKRNITAGANALGGAVFKVTDTSTGSSTINSDLILGNEALGSGTFTGNLLRLQLAGTDKFVVDKQGALSVSLTGIGSGTLNGISIGGITGGAGTETALNIGSGWDNAISANGVAIVGDGTTNYFKLDPNNGPQYFGTAQPVKSVILSPEYTDSTFTTDGSSSTNGSLTADTDSANNYRNYYEWTSTQASLQDYTIAVRYVLPDDFSSWPSGTCPGTTCPITFEYQTGVSGTTNNAWSAIVNKTTAACYTVSSGVSSTAWTTISATSANLTGTCSWAAGDQMILRIKLKANNTASAKARAGDITIRYKAKF